MKKRSRYKTVYNSLYNPYGPKQTRKKVKKNFMQPQEFLTIYELYNNLQSEEDFIFLISVIKSSKTYRHYKTCPIYRFASENIPVEEYIAKITYNNMMYLVVIMQWLYSYTIHANSLSSVTFK